MKVILGGRIAVADLTVADNAQQTVTIRNIQVVNKRCQVPLSGTFFFYPSSGPDATYKLGFDLDNSITYAREVHGAISTTPFFQNNVVTLAPVRHTPSRSTPKRLTTTASSTSRCFESGTTCSRIGTAVQRCRADPVEDVG